jgi:hypothetical protein
MKKWIGPVSSFFFVLLLGISLLSGSFSFPRKEIPKETEKGENRIRLIQDEERRGGTDSHYLQLLKEIQRKLDEWLKSINERIESEDISRFKVRFLEILRSILEWIKEKVDAKIESAEKEKPRQKEKRGIFREIRYRDLSFSKMG